MIAKPSGLKEKIPVSEQDKKLADSVLGPDTENNNIIAINPMAKWKTKLWEPDKFSELALSLQKDLNCRIVFTGSSQDRAIIDEMIKYEQR